MIKYIVEYALKYIIELTLCIHSKSTPQCSLKWNNSNAVLTSYTKANC